MSYRVRFVAESDDIDENFEFATTQGWSALADWMEALPEGEYPALAEFAEEGAFGNTVMLREQLEAALAFHPPEDGDVAHTATQFIARIGVGASDETVAVVGEDEEVEGED